ncbi:MoaF C-terminal domain-containing protein [Nocardia sp. R6R-6]|uniref:MoaF C-terminal domain-containing protein n=1 Tax=Nocardia sp. R6R-6 TaxID=3459303 RepID=UPI00403E1178
MTQRTTGFSWNKDDWTPLNEMAEGFDEYRPEDSGALTGRRIVIDAKFLDTGTAVIFTHTFTDTTVDWQTTEPNSPSGTDTYELFEMQPGLFFLHYRRSNENHPTVVTAAIDLISGQVTGAIGELGLGAHPHLAQQRWFQGRIADTESPASSPHASTDELIGRRIRYAYSSDDVYDHIYLNEHLFTWVCSGGAENGFADTDRCWYWKLRDNTYLFSWLEKNVGVEGLVLIDLDARRGVGIQFGMDQRSGELVNLTMGSYLRELTRTPSAAEAPAHPV